MAEINLLALQPNVPKANLEDYIYLLYGRPKVGKTSFFHLLVKHVFKNPNAGLLIAFEEGFKALNGIFAQKVEGWEDYVEVIDQLIDNREQIPFKLIAHDTVDKMYDMCVKFVLKREGFKDGKLYKAPSDIPWGKGNVYIAQEMSEQIIRLQNAGYGLFFITHDQDKKFESREGVSYDKTTVSLDKRARDIVLNMADFIMFIENGVEKGKKDTTVSKRWIYLRADGTDIEAGSRFPHIRDRVGYDAGEFMEAFEEAVLASHEDEDVDLNKLRKEQSAERSAKAKEFIQSEQAQRNEPTLEENIDKLDEIIKALPTAQRKEAKAFNLEKLGTANIRKATDPELVKECISFAESLKA